MLKSQRTLRAVEGVRKAVARLRKAAEGLKKVVGRRKGLRKVVEARTIN